jgi:hypothetical protein
LCLVLPGWDGICWGWQWRLGGSVVRWRIVREGLPNRNACLGFLVERILCRDEVNTWRAMVLFGVLWPGGRRCGLVQRNCVVAATWVLGHTRKSATSSQCISTTSLPRDYRFVQHLRRNATLRMDRKKECFSIWRIISLVSELSLPQVLLYRLLASLI